jgi:hypothetical protein
MSKRLLHGNDIGAFGKETRLKGMAKRVPRHSFETRLFTGQLAPRIENTLSRIVQRYQKRPPSFLDERV